MISGNMVGMYSQMGKTFILVDENGTELTGVVVDQEAVFDATDNDVREGKVYASDGGVSTGTKEIPSYYTTQGEKLITPGSNFTLSINNYDYTKLQVIICPLGDSINTSVSSERVVIDDKVYDVLSTVSLSDVLKDHEYQRIDLGITNTSSTTYVLRYFTYKEMY